MDTRVGAVLLLVLLFATPATAIGDDSALNGTETLEGAVLNETETETLSGATTEAETETTPDDAITETETTPDKGSENDSQTGVPSETETNASSAVPRGANVTASATAGGRNVTVSADTDGTNVIASAVSTQGGLGAEDLEPLAAELTDVIEADRSESARDSSAWVAEEVDDALYPALGVHPPTTETDPPAETDASTPARDRRLASADPGANRGSAGGSSGDGSTPGGAAAGFATGALVTGLVARSAITASGGAATLPTAANASTGTVFDRLLRSLVPLRYSRYDGSDPLEHEDRERLLETVEAEPGTHLTAVAESVDVPLSTARYHLRVLEREGIVDRATVRGRHRLFPAHAEAQELTAALADEAPAAVLEALARVGPCSTSELAEELDRTPSTMTHHLTRLAEDDLVVRERDGRAMVARLASGVTEVLGDEAPDGDGPMVAPADD